MVRRHFILLESVALKIHNLLCVQKRPKVFDRWKIFTFSASVFDSLIGLQCFFHSFFLMYVIISNELNLVRAGNFLATDHFSKSHS